MHLFDGIDITLLYGRLSPRMTQIIHAIANFSLSFLMYVMYLSSAPIHR